MLYVELPADLAAHWPTTTMLTDVLDRRGAERLLRRPAVAGTAIKFGDHCFSKSGDIEADRTATQGEIACVMTAARRRLRDADAYRITEARTCFYTLSPDERFHRRRHRPHHHPRRLLRPRLQVRPAQWRAPRRAGRRPADFATFQSCWRALQHLPDNLRLPSLLRSRSYSSSFEQPTSLVQRD
ncbi:MAG: hypothetical protein R3C69_06005 [Geminicoccaceae bacterium]